MNNLLNDYSALPVGHAPTPIPVPHFPDALHAVVWRNWDVIDVNSLAEVLRGTPEQITDIAYSMGLPAQRTITSQERRRNYMTILRRNWHLLPYEQLCELLQWDAARMQFALNEDDFMWVKLGGYKPECPAVYYEVPDEATEARAREIAAIVENETLGDLSEPLFGFIECFDTTLTEAKTFTNGDGFEFTIVYPYFLRFGDPLLGEGISDVPEGYLSALAASGINGIWIQAVLNTLAPWDLAPELSKGWEERLANLNLLVERCRKFGIEVFIYLNEPRAMPHAFFETYPELRGVYETPDRAPYSPDVVALCTSTKPVQDFLVNSVQHVFEQVPDLGGVLCITFSENLTNCYSREYDPNIVDEFTLPSALGAENCAHAHELKPCPRCAERGPEIVSAEVCNLLQRGMRQAGSKGRFLLYGWSTPEAWFPKIIENLSDEAWLICISEWGQTFTRGDYTGKVNEYSISVTGPSEQSLRQWGLAKQGGLRIAAKMQAANTYELSSMPYIPALRSVAEHLSRVTEIGVDGVLLGWTAGGSPSPNLELVQEFAQSPRPTVEEALTAVATRRFGAEAVPRVIEAWNLLSDAYNEFPFDMSVCYNGPQSHGPSNLLYAQPTGFVATMCTFPFDDLRNWRGPYSESTFLGQFEKVAAMWKLGVELLEELRKTHPSSNLDDEWRIAAATGIHFQSVANQIRFIQVRGTDKSAAAAILRDEIELSRQLMALVAEDSRIGFEATNQYGYIRYDLAEKILNCNDLLKQFA